MSIIEKTIRLHGSKGEVKRQALFDSGASYSCIRRELAEEIEVLVPLPEPVEFGTADAAVRLTARFGIRLNFYLNEDRFSDEFMVIDGLSEDVVIGAKTLQAWRMKLDFENDEVLYDPRVQRLRIVSCDHR